MVVDLQYHYSDLSWQVRVLLDVSGGRAVALAEAEALGDVLLLGCNHLRRRLEGPVHHKEVLSVGNVEFEKLWDNGLGCDSEGDIGTGEVELPPSSFINVKGPWHPSRQNKRERDLVLPWLDKSLVDNRIDRDASSEKVVLSRISSRRSPSLSMVSV